MRIEREYWPLVWTVDVRAGESPVTIFDLVELRATVDVLRVSAGLPPVAWAGRTDEDPTFEAGKTLIRAVHFTQLRAALAELHAAGDLGRLGEFTGGEIVPGTRPIRLTDVLDLRGWVEEYEQRRPDLAARVVRLYGGYSAAGLEEEPVEGKLTEVWDGAGFSRCFYDAAGRVVREVRTLDSHEYWTAYEYDAEGRVTGLTYPDGERIGVLALRPEEAGSRAVDTEWAGFRTLHPEGWPGEARSSAGHFLGEAAPRPTGWQALAEAWERTGEGAAKSDALGRPVALGNPARPVLRLAYDGDGKLVKRLDERGTVHFVGEHYEHNLGRGDGQETATRYAPDGVGGRWRLLPHPLAPSLDRPHPLAPSPHGGEGGAEGGRLESKDGLGWRMPDELWEKARPVLPEEKVLGAGTESVSTRQILDMICYVQHTGTPWSALPSDFGMPASLYPRLAQWRATGVLARLAEAGVIPFDVLGSLP